jgi:hypothetical protein
VSDSDEAAADGDYDSDNEPTNGNGAIPLFLIFTSCWILVSFDRSQLGNLYRVKLLSQFIFTSQGFHPTRVFTSTRRDPTPGNHLSQMNWRVLQREVEPKPITMIPTHPHLQTFLLQRLLFHPPKIFYEIFKGFSKLLLKTQNSKKGGSAWRKVYDERPNQSTPTYPVVLWIYISHTNKKLSLICPWQRSLRWKSWGRENYEFNWRSNWLRRGISEVSERHYNKWNERKEKDLLALW